MKSQINQEQLAAAIALLKAAGEEGKTALKAALKKTKVTWEQNDNLQELAKDYLASETNKSAVVFTVTVDADGNTVFAGYFKK
jgi:hypothetical protein